MQVGKWKGVLERLARDVCFAQQWTVLCDTNEMDMIVEGPESTSSVLGLSK